MRPHAGLPFLGLCLYIGSQAITVPLFPLGNWAVWPNLSDFAWLAFLLMSLPHLLRYRAVEKSLLWMLMGAVTLCALSLGILTLYWPVLHDATLQKGADVGIYQLYRLVQFLVIFWLVSKAPLPPHRVRILHGVCLATTVFVCVSCLATYWFISTSVFGGHLIGSVAAAGPWAPYITGLEHFGVGATNINHCFTGIHILLLVALTAQTARPSTSPPWLIMLAFVAIFISEHRTGLIFFAVYLCMLLRPSVRYVTWSVFILGIAGLVAAYTWSDTEQALSGAIERQSTITTSYSTDGFSARDQIWQDRLDFLNENKARWIVGSGFGSAIESGPNAHMLFLHLVLETGVLGLVIFLGIVSRVLVVLWRVESSPRPLFCGTVCLLGTCFTQETFYPVAAFEHFIGLFLCAVAIAIRSHHDEQEDWSEEDDYLDTGELEMPRSQIVSYGD